MVSWAVFGTTFWIIVGTTTLASVILWVVNTFQFGEYIAQKVGDYLTRESGLQIKFESAVGDYKQKLIRLKNVSVVLEGNKDIKQSEVRLTMEYVDIKLSLLWLLEGKGVVKECKASGIRGFIDRRPENNGSSNRNKSENNSTPRRKPRRGDFVLENLMLTDLFITLYLPEDNRPLPISIYTLNCDWFRKQWMLLDFLSSRSVVGRFDGCLFTFGIPQRVGSQPINNLSTRELKIDGVSMDLLSRNATGPLGWIKEGTLDISLLLTLPPKHIPKHIDGSETRGPHTHQYYGLHAAGAGGSAGSDFNAHTDHHQHDSGEPIEDAMRMQFECMFNHMHVAAPLYTPHLSYLSNALVHPILAYMNAHGKHIPLTFEVIMNKEQFNGAWTPSSAGLFDALSRAVGVALSHAVAEKKNAETLKVAAGTFLKDLWEWVGGLVPARVPTYI